MDCSSCVESIDSLILHTKGEVEGNRNKIKNLTSKLQELELKYNKSIDRDSELAMLVKQNEELREALEEIEKEKITGTYFAIHFGALELKPVV